MIYRIEVRPTPGMNDARCAAIANDIRALGIDASLRVEVADLYFIDGDLSKAELKRVCVELLCDGVVQTFDSWQGEKVDGSRQPYKPSNPPKVLIEVAFKPGVTDATAVEIVRATRQLRITGVTHAATGTAYLLEGQLDHAQVQRITKRLLCNDVIQTFTLNAPIQPLNHSITQSLNHSITQLLNVISIRKADDTALMALNKERRLSLNIEEMRVIRDYFVEIQRDPTDAEIETLAQTWSEHCVHKTFKAKIDVKELRSERVESLLPISSPSSGHVDGLLQTFIKKATDQIAAPWVKSAFVDNAGIIAFDDMFDLSFKAETHNHPSAIEPFGGANTGVGGVIRDVIAVSARPIANTDVLCFGPQDLPFDALPEGVLHPRRVRQGVVAGVEDYGNKMGIPTVSGAIVYDKGYTANPLVFCGCVGIAPVNSHPRNARVGDRIIVIGGRTGRDGLRGATFSSSALTVETSDVAGSSVQIGNPIVEKNAMEVVLAARDAKLYSAITDCGAGGLSSAVGEMGAELGVQVQLEDVPLKYAGLTPWEIWLSEAQERFVLALAPENIAALKTICARFDCEMRDIGTFTGDGHLRVNYRDQRVCDMSMAFLHDGLPRRILKAEIRGKGDMGPTRAAVSLPSISSLSSISSVVKNMLAHPNVASKEEVIRVYDHEVQGGCVIKPLVGVGNHGPSDATVIKPLGTRGTKGFALACGINPNIGKHDAYAMAVSVIDEAIRNLVCVGTNPARIALLDNFCWGDPNDPETLGTLVEACRGCYDAAKLFGTPFISGKDSLNNTYLDLAGGTSPSGSNRVSIPGTLLISAIGIVDDVTRCVTMDLKRIGSRVCLLGETKDEMSGSLFEQLASPPPHPFPEGGEATSPALWAEGGASKFGNSPSLPQHAPLLYSALHNAIQHGLVLTTHDCSEGGLAVALVEMAQAGALGITLQDIGTLRLEIAMFSESNGRIVVEVAPEHAAQFEMLMREVPYRWIGTTTEQRRLTMADGTVLFDDE